MRQSERVFEAALAGYRRSLDFVLRHRPATLGVTLATIVVAVGLYAYDPEGLLPGGGHGLHHRARWKPRPTSRSPPWRAHSSEVAAVVRKDPDVDYVVYTAGATGISRTSNTGRLFVALKPRE